MQGLCRLSRRWHQQFCHSPSFVGAHQRCLQAYIPVRNYRQGRRTRPPQRSTHIVPSDAEAFFATNDHDANPRSPSNLLSRDGDDLVVNEFEQYGSDKSTRVQIDPEKDMTDEASIVWEELQEVDRQLKIAQQGPFGPQSEFMKQLPADQREEVLKALREQGIVSQDEEDVLDLAEIDRLMEEDREETADEDGLAVTLHIPKAHHALVSHFNKALKEAQDSKGDTLKVLNLWKWYLRCQQKIPEFSRIISGNVWTYLWNSQRNLEKRPQHLVMLGRDMEKAEEPMNEDQSLEYIRALYACDDALAALSEWEALKTRLRSDESLDVVSSFYSIGVQLFAAVGRPQKAQSTAFTAIRKGADPALLVHVVSAWAQDVGTPDRATKAWATYLKMRSLLGENMTPELYEKVSDALLDSKQSKMALTVFKDMIAKIRGSGKNTLDSYQQALGKIDKEGDSEDVERAINQVSLTMLLTIPKEYHNKFFFASWIKKLLGQQRIEAASMVVDLMYERNIKPDAIHLNGIIGAWLRDKSPKSRERAEKLAYEMIQAKINQVDDWAQNKNLRHFGNIFRKVMPLDESNNVWKTPIHLGRPVPAANVETFSLLFDYNEERHRWHEFEQLTQTMIGPAQLKPNSFIINKWLAAELRARSFSRFWTLFNGLKNEIQPNVETFGLAWQAVAAQHSASKVQSTISHRQLFAGMMQWAENLKSRQKWMAKEDFEAGFYAEIMRSFCYQLDLPGTLCAMQGLYGAFGATPNDVSIRLITGQAARVLPRTDSRTPATGGRRRVHAKLAIDQTMLKGIADIVDNLEAEKKMNLVESGQADAGEVEDIDSAASKKVRLDVMIEFLTIVMQKTKKDGDNPVKTLRDVARTMHVSIEDVVASASVPDHNE